MRTFLWSVATLWFSYSAVAQNGSEPVLITDMLKIKTVGNITTSRDGSKAAFTVTSIEGDENNKSDYKYITQIYTVGSSGNDTPIQLTTTKEGASQPSWSPDGSQLAFVRTVEGKPQIFLLSFKGGEALQLTKYKYGASGPRWSPDGKQILFSSSIPIEDLVKDTVLNATRAIPQWPYEKPGYDKNEQFRSNKAKADPNGNSDEIQAYLDKNVGDKKAIVLNKLNFQNEMNISAEMNFNQLFIIDVGNPGSQPRLITKMFHRYGGAAFLPDGKQIIMSGDVDSLEAPDRSQENQIYSRLANAAASGVLRISGGFSRITTHGTIAIEHNPGTMPATNHFAHVTT
jgi:Tol biopolymer transport system component